MFPLNTHILLVDDMKGVRMLFLKILKDMGFTTITEAANGVEAYDALVKSQSSNPVGLIISDIRMPEMDGLQLLEKVRGNATMASLPFIMLTAETERENVVKAVKNNVSEYIVKPTTGPVLAKKLEQVWTQIQSGGKK